MKPSEVIERYVKENFNFNNVGQDTLITVLNTLFDKFSKERKGIEPLDNDQGGDGVEFSANQAGLEICGPYEMIGDDCGSEGDNYEHLMVGGPENHNYYEFMEMLHNKEGQEIRFETRFKQAIIDLFGAYDNINPYTSKYTFNKNWENLYE